MTLNRLCFGTSTFVAGRLRPGKDSAPGMAALHAAIGTGVRLIHSNPKLGTQWAIRRVLDRTSSAPLIRHLIKAEAPLDAEEQAVADKITTAIGASRERLAVDRLHAIVLEIDIKRTRQPKLLDDIPAAQAFFRLGARLALDSGYVADVYAYCHRPAHVAAALACPDIAGIAAQYHQADPWVADHLAEITRAGRTFVGMSPLNRGLLVDRSAGTPNGRLAALQWALADPRVSAVVITMSSVEHLEDVIRAFGYSGSINDPVQRDSGPGERSPLGDQK